MTTRRIALVCLALGTTLSACSGYRSGPAIYSRVSLESPWRGAPYGSRATGDPDVGLPSETLPEPAPDAGLFPAMGMPDAADLDQGDR